MCENVTRSCSHVTTCYIVVRGGRRARASKVSALPGLGQRGLIERGSCAQACLMIRGRPQYFCIICRCG